MAEEKTIDVEPEVIDAPATITEADRWLAGQRERVEARARDFEAFDITTAEQYRDAKAQRKALRALIAEVDGDKRRMTKQLRDTLARFNGEVSGILAGLTETDMQYKSEIERWERSVVIERDARIEARYRDEYPDLAAQVPYDRLRARYGADWKADNYGTKESAIWAKVEAAVRDVADGLATIGAQTHVNGTALSEEDKTDLVAEYLRTLDMAAALRMTQQRVEQREALRRAEEERRAWEAEQAAAQTAVPDAPETAQEAAESPQDAAPVPTPTVAEVAPQAGAQGAGRVLAFRVEVPESRTREFISEMKRLGFHGRLLREG